MKDALFGSENRFPKWRSEIAKCLLVLLGSLILAAGFVLFTNPYRIIPGGVYGLGRILHHVIPGIQTGTFGLMMDIPLLVTAIIVFGKGIGTKTVIASLSSPLIMNWMTSVVGEDPEQAGTFLYSSLNFSDNILVASIFGGVLIGLGMGLILRTGATSGGTDIVSMLLSRVTGMKFSASMMIVESIIVISGMIVLGDWKIPLYSLIAIFVSSKTIDLTLEGGNSEKILFVISDRRDEIREYVLYKLERGATLLQARGAYSGETRDMLFIVVSRRELSGLKESIRRIDRSAFVVVADAKETYGYGFSPFEGKS